MKDSYFSREISGALKGIALIMMFVHHFFTFPDWIVCGVEYPWIQNFTNWFCAATASCVGVFLFLTGYFYTFSDGGWKRSFKKIVDFLLSYWLVCGVLIAAAVGMDCFPLSKRGILQELLGQNNARVMTFCWYVSFYCVILLILPLLYRKDVRLPVLDVLGMLVLPLIVLNVGKAFTDFTVFSGMLQWYPCLAVSCLFGKYDLFRKWFDARLEQKRKWYRIVVWVLMTWIGFRGYYYFQGWELGTLRIRSWWVVAVLPENVLFVPIFLYGAANLLSLFRGHLRVLEKIGERSMLMWFYHCIFFNCCRQITQKFLYFPKNPVLVLLNGLVLCYAAAALTEPVRKALIAGKNRLLTCLKK